MPSCCRWRGFEHIGRVGSGSSLLRLISDLSEEARDRIGANRHVNASEQLVTEAVRCAILPQLDNAIRQRHQLGMMARLPAA
jgi:hypothetical protein